MPGKLTQFGPAPKIWVSKVASDKMSIWTDLAVGEVSAFGVTEDKYDSRDRLSEIRVRDVFLAEQTCTASSTIIEPEMTADCMRQAEAAGYDPGKLVFWFHSHVNMAVFWSKTDTDNMDLLSRDANILSIVKNKRNEYRCRYDMAYPLRLVYDELDVEFESESLAPGVPALATIEGLNTSTKILSHILQTDSSKTGLGHILAELKALEDRVNQAGKQAKDRYDALTAVLKEEFDRKVKSPVYTPAFNPATGYTPYADGQLWDGGDWVPTGSGWGHRAGFGIAKSGQVKLLSGDKDGNKKDNEVPAGVKSGKDVAEQLIDGEISPEQAVYGIQEDAIILMDDIQKKYPKVVKSKAWQTLRPMIEIGLENVGLYLAQGIGQFDSNLESGTPTI